EKVDEIVLKELKSARANGGNPYLEDALAVAMDPQTGEVLALSGFHYDKESNEYQNSPHKTLYDSNLPGSTVKGATVRAGLGSDVVSPGQTVIDSTSKSKGRRTRCSYVQLGSVNDVPARKRYSGVYMFYSALRLGGDFRYRFPDNSKANVDADGGIQKVRNYYNQLGLAVKTGIA